MALIYDGVTCAICGEVIDRELLDADEFVATTHFIGDPTSPLWQFSDAPMHKKCFLAWPLREQFVRAYNEAMKGDDLWHDHMNDDGEIVRANNDAG